jgi:PKD repeat protein
LPKTAPSIAASIALLAVFASPVQAAPNPAYTVDPSPPRCGDQATYSDASTVDALLAVAKVEWDFNNDGTYEVVDAAAPFQANHVYGTRGAKTFGMRVTDNAMPMAGVTAEDQTVNVVTAAPQADFTPSDAAPLVNDEVLFASDVSDPDGDAIASYAWDFDDDGTTDSTARNPVHNFDSPGPKTVKLRVVDSCGAPSTFAEHVLNVVAPTVPNNALPVARFVFSPRTAEVGEPVEFQSSSFDSDGQVREQAWDLDGDGAFDDARGEDIFYTFTSAGTKTVRLRVTDSAGASSISQRQITVNAPPKPPRGHLRPDPDVRFRGLLFGTGTRVQILAIKAPRGAMVTVRCKGKSCGVKQRRKRIKKGAVRFKTYERFLRAGVRLEIFIAKPGKIGEYRRYTIRGRSKPPTIRQRCLNGTKLRPVKC